MELGQPEHGHHRIPDDLREHPPWRSTTGFTPSKYSVRIVSRVSGRGSPRPVESTTSEKRIVTTCRKRSGVSSSSGRPHARQNRAPVRVPLPHPPHAGTRRVYVGTSRSINRGHWFTFSPHARPARPGRARGGLHRVDLFAGVPGRVLAAVAEATKEVRAAAGDVLIEEGAVEAHLFAVVEDASACTGATRPCWSSAVHDRRRARRARAAAALGVGDRDGADARPARRQGSARRSPRDWPELTDGVIAALVARLPRHRRPGRRRAVTGAPARRRRPADAQALAFGVTLALLIVPANALFLDAYGSSGCP